MIGLTIIDNTGNITTYNPHIPDNQVHFELASFQASVEGAALSIAAQINTYITNYDLANVTTITLALNGNEVVFINSSD